MQRENRSSGGRADAHHQVHLPLWRVPLLHVVPHAQKGFTVKLRALAGAPVEN